MKRPVKKIGAAVLAAMFLCSFLISGCRKRSESNAVKDESGLVLSGKMPDMLPDGMSWYDFSESTDIFDYLKDNIGE